MTPESIIHATCTRIREAKGLPECLQCPAVVELEHYGPAEHLCYSIAKAAWDKEAEND
jgi:hypothetical protein